MYKVEGMHNALKVESMQRRREVCTGGAYVSPSLNGAFVAARCLVVIRLHNTNSGRKARGESLNFASELVALLADN